jgi:hypothetical protein
MEAARRLTNHPGRCAAAPPLKGGESARSNKCREASYAAQTGWLVNSNKNKVRYAIMKKHL